MRLNRPLSCAFLSVLVAAPAAAQNGLTFRASVDASGGDPDAGSYAPSISADGRFLAFQSNASDVVPGDVNGLSDVFVRDLLAGTTARVSVGLGGAQANGDSKHPSISADGSRVAFCSGASNLVTGDSNGQLDVFVVDVATLAIQRVSVSNTGVQANGASIYPALSDDGLRVAFESSANNLDPADFDFDWDVYWRDLPTGTTLLVSRSLAGASGDGPSGGDDHDGPDITADGKEVVFWSRATDLVPNDTNGPTGPPPNCITCGDDVFVCNVSAGTMARVSVSSAGVQSNNASLHPSISGTGRFVAYYSRASNLVSGDTGPWSDIFVHDRDADGNGVFDEAGGIATVRASVSSAGVQGNNYSGGGGFGWKGPDLSRDGSRVAFFSQASNFDPADPNAGYDCYVHDLASSTTWCVSVDPIGQAGDARSYSAALSGDGVRVAFVSLAGDLVAGDGNDREDVFVRSACPAPVVYCTAQTNSLGCTSAISSTGTPSASVAVPFTIRAANLKNHAHGSLIYSLVGPLGAPFQGGTLCVHAPLKRTPTQPTGGTGSGSDCTGSVALDFNAYAQSGINPALVDGASVWAQVWSRDPGAAFGSNLSDAIAFILCAP